MRFLLLLAAVMIAGCATTRVAIEPDQDVQIDTWQIKGRLAANIAGEGGTASFVWDKNQNNHLIEIYGPLGSGRVILAQANGQASLIDKDAEFTGADLQDVLYQRTGWLVPFDSLANWVTGRPTSAQAYSNLHHDQDALTGFTQSGWVVDYARFGDFSGTVIPVKMSLTATSDYLDALSRRLGRPVDSATVKIIIKDLERE